MTDEERVKAKWPDAVFIRVRGVARWMLIDPSTVPPLAIGSGRTKKKAIENAAKRDSLGPLPTLCKQILANEDDILRGMKDSGRRIEEGKNG